MRNMQQNYVLTIPVLGPVPAPPTGHSWESLMDIALEEARIAADHAEVPVGAVVVTTQGTILARAHNAMLRQHNPTAHAEILALQRAGKAVRNYRLHNTILIVTLEPCLMCAGALVHSRITGLVYGAADAKAGAVTSCCAGLDYSFINHTIWHMGGIRATQCAALLHEFFHTARAAQCSVK